MVVAVAVTGAGLAACSSGSKIAPPLGDGDDDDEGSDASMTMTGSDATTGGDTGTGVSSMLDATASEDADPCPAQRAQLNDQLANTACGVCVSSSCSSFVTDVMTSCTTVVSAINLLTCAEVSHSCTMGAFYQGFNTVELASLYQCGSFCYQPCGLKAPAGSGDDAAAPDDAGVDSGDAAIVDAAFDAKG